MSNLTIKHAGTTQTATAGTEKKGGALVKLSPTVSGTAYTEGDIIFTKQELENAVATRGGLSLLTTVTAFVEGAVTNDDLVLLFFDNATALGAVGAEPMTDVTAAEFIAASCIGKIGLNGGTSSILCSAGAGRIYSNSSMNDASSYGGVPILIKAADTKTSIWVAMIQPAGTLDLVDTDSIALTFGFQYI
jgi:hypothetical protein